MMTPLTDRQHTLLSFAVLFVITAAVILFVVQSALGERIAFLSRLSTLREVYAKSSAAIFESETVQRRIEAQQVRAAASEAFLRAETAALAAAELQNAIKTLVEGERGTLVSSAFRERREALPLTPVTVVVRLRCSVEALQHILMALERHEPPLFVESVLIQSRHRPGRPLEDPAQALDVEFEVTGYLERPSEP